MPEAPLDSQFAFYRQQYALLLEQLSMRIFVDVGAHYGESLGIALDPAWGFDRVFAVEPASVCQPLLRQFRDGRLLVQPIALGSLTGTAVLHGAGLLGASLFASKRQEPDVSLSLTETINVVRASEWFRLHIPPNGEVYMKFNCEGAECDIIDDLLSFGASDRLASLYIDFDVRKVTEQAYRQAEVERRLQDQGVSYTTPESLGLAGPPGVAKWLSIVCPRRRPSRISALRYRLGLHEPPYIRTTSVLRHLLPKVLYQWLARHFGRLARAVK